MIAPAIQGDRKLGIPLTHTGDSHAKQSQTDPSTEYTANFTFGEETLGIASNIYVLSLPHRMDRRMSMERLRQTLGLQWTYINAIDSEADTTRNIYAHIHDRRARVEEGVVTGLLDDTFEWPNATSVDTLALSASPLGLSDSDYWSLRPPSNGVDNSGTALLTESDLDDSAASAGYPQLLVASSDAEAQHDPLPSLPPLTCASKDYVTGPPFELGLPGYMLLTPAKVSCWYSHLKIIRKVADGHTTEKAAFREPREHAEDVSLILEDDVDMEHDIHARLRQVWPLLPAQWDIVFLGMCQLTLRYSKHAHAIAA
ncbi:hypothetical protein EVJ58_g4794 [Rhodofomes roseus]|uniref:Glycosyltransferase family 25 protein n=1 Tax=Rhodofomes roseus TaxID=34475 RepID=A0A4Y9YJ38_9APHY|nr:hypothetical protein EVJ58_g4794 [Rhodofomes roseus]